MNFRLYNTATRSLEDFVPANPAEISFYTCGPTVYDDAHIGNFRSFLAADLLRRWLESPLCTLSDGKGGSHRGPRTVTHVMNITDVGHMTDDGDADGGGEDKMLAAEQRILEAKKSGKLPPDAKVDPGDPSAVAEFYTARFIEDAKALGLKVASEAERDPSLMPRATDNIAGMKEVIVRLLESGDAYTGGEPGSRAVYFDVQRFKAYGSLSGNTLDNLRGGAGGRVDNSNQQQKKHPADFLLWKEDPSHKMKWPPPDHASCAGWEDGYPGWHIECTAMALGRLGPDGLSAAHNKKVEIDLHSGGEDNIFPHHECEIAQSCAFTDAKRFARHWFHPRFLMVNGAKMSKSKGTFYTPRDLMAKGIDPAAIRLELIKTHYRANADFSMEGLRASEKRIKNWRNLARKLTYSASLEQGSQPFTVVPLQNKLEDAVDGLFGDLQPATLIAFLDETASLKGQTETYPEDYESLLTKVNATQIAETPDDPKQAVAKWKDHMLTPAERSLAALHLIDNILGVIFRPVEKSKDTGIAVYLPGAEPSAEVESLLAERRDAKQAKDFARSDAIRDQLSGMGYAVKDIPGGRVEVGPA